MLTLTINGNDYSWFDAIRPSVERREENLVATMSLSLINKSAQIGSVGNDIYEGADVVLKEESITLFEGIILSKHIMERRGNVSIDIDCADPLIWLANDVQDVNIRSESEPVNVDLHFIDDNSGATGDIKYTRLALLKAEGASASDPPLDRDLDPTQPMRVWADKSADSTEEQGTEEFNVNDYEYLNTTKRIVFSEAQWKNQETPSALPADYDDSVSPTPSNRGWTYHAVVLAFRNEEWPSRILSDPELSKVLESIINDRVTTSITRSYTKGSSKTIKNYLPERTRDHIQVSAVATSSGTTTITTSENHNYSTSDTIRVLDEQGGRETGNMPVQATGIDTIEVNESDAAAWLIDMEGEDTSELRVVHHQINVLALDVDTSDFNNLNRIEVDGTEMFVRGIEDDSTLLVANQDDSPDFSHVSANGNVVYPTVEYVGTKIDNLNWNKEQGEISQLIQQLYDNFIIPRNYQLRYEPELGAAVGRFEQQVQVEVTAINSGTEFETTNVDIQELVPGEQLRWLDGSDQVVAEIASLSYDSSLQVTLTTSETGSLSVGDVLDARFFALTDVVDAEPSLNLEDIPSKITVVSSSTFSNPILGPRRQAVDAGDLNKTDVVRENIDSEARDGSGSQNLHTSDGGSTGPCGNNDYAIMTNEGVGDPLDTLGTSTVNGYMWKNDSDSLDISWCTQPGEAWVLEYDFGEMKRVSDLVLCCSEPVARSEPVSQVYALPRVTLLGATEINDQFFTPVSSDLINQEVDYFAEEGDTFAVEPDLLEEFRYLRVVFSKPLHWKGGESNFGGGADRAQQIVITSLEAYEDNKIIYTERDINDTGDYSDSSILPLMPVDDIGERPFAELTNVGGDVDAVSGSDPWDLQIDNHGLAAGDNIMFYDASEERYVAGDVDSVISTGASGEITVTSSSFSDSSYTPTAGDEVGSRRRWLQDIDGNVIDTKLDWTLDNKMAKYQREQIIENEFLRTAKQATALAAERLIAAVEGTLEYRTTVRATPDRGVRLWDVVRPSERLAPAMVTGWSYDGRNITLRLTDFNFDATSF